MSVCWGSFPFFSGPLLYIVFLSTQGVVVVVFVIKIQLKQMSNSPGFYFNIGNKARDVLYKDYAQQPPLHFHSACFDWNFDLSCQSEEILPGLTAVFRFIIPDSSTVDIRYLNEHAGLSAGFGAKAYPNGGFDPTLNFSCAIGGTLLSLGADVAFDFPTKSFSKYNASFSFNTPSLSTSLTLNDKLDTLKLSCYHSFANTGIAAELKHGFERKESGLTVGVQRVFFSSTLVKARINSYYRAAVVVRQGLWHKLFVTLSGEVDVRDLNRTPKIGLTIALRP